MKKRDKRAFVAFLSAEQITSPIPSSELPWLVAWIMRCDSEQERTSC